VTKPIRDSLGRRPITNADIDFYKRWSDLGEQPLSRQEEEIFREWLRS